MNTIFLNRKTICSLFATLLFFAVLIAVCDTVLSGAVIVDAVVQFDHRDRIQLFYSNGLGNKEFRETYSLFSKPITKGTKQKVRISSGNIPVRRIRLDMGELPGRVTIYQLTVAGRYAKNVILSPTEIHRLFSSDSAETSVRLEKDYLELQTHEDSYLICDTPLLRANPLPLYGIPLLFSMIFFCILQQVRFSQLAPFADIRRKRPSSGENIDALDGLRGIALLMVVADHTLGWFSGVGASGVWIFMSLSGFLLARPFVRRPESAISLSFWRHFFLRRFRRIVPVYYTYIVIIFLFNGYFNDAVLHFLFIEGSGHLWVVPQEIFFYLLTPPVMLVNYLIFRGRAWLVLPNLIALTLLANRFLDTDVVTLYGMHNIGLRPFFGVFLSGVTVSWFYYGIWQKKGSPLLRGKIQPFAAACAVLLLFFFLLCSHERLWGGNRTLTQLYFPWYGGAAALLILAVLSAGQSAVTRFLSLLPLRALSVVSFSVYIFHTLMLGVIRKGTGYYLGEHLSGFPLFMATLLLSYLFACITYSLLERPFLRSGTT